MSLPGSCQKDPSRSQKGPQQDSWLNKATLPYGEPTGPRFSSQCPSPWLLTVSWGSQLELIPTAALKHFQLEMKKKMYRAKQKLKIWNLGRNVASMCVSIL